MNIKLQHIGVNLAKEIYEKVGFIVSVGSLDYTHGFEVKERLEKCAQYLVEHGSMEFMNIPGKGFDQVAFWVIKEFFPVEELRHTRLFNRLATSDGMEVDPRLKDRADSLEVTGNPVHYMVDWCNLLVVVWDGNPGHASKAIDYAKKIGKPILLLKCESPKTPEIKEPEKVVHKGTVSQVEKALREVKLYAAGAFSGTTPSFGSYASILVAGDKEKVLKGGTEHTTHNRMEVLSVLEGLRALKAACSVEVFSENKYVINGLSQWLANWEKYGWKDSKKEEIKNKDLWEEIAKLMKIHKISATLLISSDPMAVRVESIATLELQKHKANYKGEIQ